MAFEFGLISYNACIVHVEVLLYQIVSDIHFVFADYLKGTKEYNKLFVNIVP